MGESQFTVQKALFDVLKIFEAWLSALIQPNRITVYVSLCRNKLQNLDGSLAVGKQTCGLTNLDRPKIAVCESAQHDRISRHR
jgi:hypothetical protein